MIIPRLPAATARVLPIPLPARAAVFLAGATLALTLLNQPGAHAADWPIWRGPNGNGVTSEPSGWDGESWIPEQPAWTAQTAQGETSPILARGNLYVFGWKNGRDMVTALDADSGKTLWTQSYPSPGRGRNAIGDMNLYVEGPIATPTFDPATGLLFTLGVDGDLHGWDTERDGTKIWGFNLYDRYHAPQRPNTGGGVRDYGYTTVPFIYKDWVIVEVGAPDQATLMAFDKRTGGSPVGTPAWKSSHKNHAGHTGGPVALTIDGKPALAVMTIDELLVIRLDPGHEGETLATYPFKPRMGANVVSPTIWKDLAVLSNHFCPGDDLIRIASSGIEKIGDCPHTEVGAPVFHQGRVYRGSGRLECFQLEGNTFESLWEGPLLGSEGTVILTGDDKVIAYGRKRLYLLTTAGEQLAEIRGMPGGWQHPTLADGRLIIKDAEGNVLCYPTTK